LYQVDSEGIEPAPLAADFLLSSSFKFSEDITVVGGKEVETYGIDVNTGQVCWMNAQLICVVMFGLFVLICYLTLHCFDEPVGWL